MQGEFRGDFSRDTFRPDKHYAQVLMQQGRVLLDADWNEQTSILLHYLRSLAVDLMGPHGAPDRRPKDTNKKPTNTEPMDFEVLAASGATGQVRIGNGHYYVNGILCENDSDEILTYPPVGEVFENGKQYLVYLDVWERHVTSLEDDEILEKALNGPDTATRAKVTWQVKRLDISDDVGSDTPSRDWVELQWGTLFPDWKSANRGQLRAMAKKEPDADTDPCLASPEARYRGAENQLYRVEIHKEGEAATATFKWSRDNGSVTFPVRLLSANTVTLGHLGRDNRSSLATGDWVEIVDDDKVLAGDAGNLGQVQGVNPDDLTVTVKWSTSPASYDEQSYAAKHVLLRRWDYRTSDVSGTSVAGKPEPADDGALKIKEAQSLDPDKDPWMTLEEGVQIQFQSPSSGNAHQYRTGDYWLIPARTATGDVEWPKASDETALAVPPHGVQHHYAPLAVVSLGGTGAVTPNDCRRLWTLLGT